MNFIQNTNRLINILYQNKTGTQKRQTKNCFFNFRSVLSFYLEFKIKFIVPCHSSNIFKLHFVLFLVFWGVVSRNQAASSSAFFGLRKRDPSMLAITCE